jgi:fatty-acyl-CoA synthase
MFDDLRQRVEAVLPPQMKKYVRVAETAARTAGVLQKTGLLGALSARGVLNFARNGAGGGKPGPHLLLRLHAFNTPDKVAVVSAATGERFTYAEFDQRICRLAHALARLGVGPGTSVALMLKNCFQYLEIQFALQHLRATIVQVGYRLKAPEVAYILENSQSKVFLFNPDYLSTAKEAAKTAGLKESSLVIVGEGDAGGLARYEDIIEAAGPQSAPPQSNVEGNPGLMVYTSGTTGKPKGALRDLKKTGIGQVFAFMSKLPISHEDRHLAVCPLYHSAAPAFVMLTFLVGGTVVVLEHYDPEEVLKTIEFERITSTMMVPTMFSRIVNLPKETLRKYDTSSLRWMMSGAAPLPTALAGKIEDTLGQILYNFYGATETGFVTIALPGEHTARPGTIGRAVDGNDIRFLDDQGNEVQEGQVGELWVANSMLISGYYRNDDATKKSKREGYFTVGDLGRRDEDGYIYLADRKIDMVISGGVNIYPLEIEEHLHKHPAIMDAAVVGVPDEEWGEALCAFIVLRQGEKVSAEDVRTYVKKDMADYKKPKYVIFIDALPRNPTGKVLKRELRDQAKAQVQATA